MRKARYYAISFAIVTAISLASLEAAARVYFFAKSHKGQYLFYGFPEHVASPVDKARAAGGTPAKTDNLRSGGDEKYYVTPINMRYRKIPYEKGPGVYRIITLGGSTTWGGQARDDETYPYYLERLLNDAGKRKYEVINAGVCAYDTAMLLNLMKEDLRRLKSDMVIIHTGWNDIFPAIQEHNRLQSLSNRAVIWLMKHSLFFVAFREKVGLILHGHAEYAWYGGKPKRGRSDKIVLDHPSFNDYGKNLDRLIRYLKDENVKVVLVRFPHREYHDRASSHEVNLTSYFWKQATDKLFGIMDRVAADNDTPVIDCESPFEARDKSALLYDVMHTTVEGNKLLARVMRDWLHDNGIG